MNSTNIDITFIKKILEENHRYRMVLAIIADSDFPYAPITDHSAIQFYEKLAQDALNDTE